MSSQAFSFAFFSTWDSTCISSHWTSCMLSKMYDLLLSRTYVFFLTHSVYRKINEFIFMTASLVQFDRIKKTGVSQLNHSGKQKAIYLLPRLKYKSFIESVKVESVYFIISYLKICFILLPSFIISLTEYFLHI